MAPNVTLPLDESPATKEVSLQRVESAANPIVAMILQHADTIDVEKLRQIIALQEHIMDRDAETAFNAAFARMQPEIPTIAERSTTDKTKYAPLEDIIDVVRPILAQHGFTLSHRTEWPDKQTVKVIGILTHLEGHARTSEFPASADQTGSKNAIQALGSSVSYGKRYTTKDLLCIVTRDEDDDGRGSTKKDAPPEPTGYAEFMTALTAAATKGNAALYGCWNKAAPKFRQYCTKHERGKWDALKAEAEQVKA